MHPHHAESCLTTGDDDCDGLENENCSRWYVERVEGSILFDTFGAMFSTQRWAYSNDAGDRLCDLFENAPNAYSAPECPQCEWTFTAIQSSAAWSANCAANLGLFEGSPPAEPLSGQPLGYASYYRTEAGEIWGPVLLIYVGGEWYPTYGLNQSGGYSMGPITVVNFGERSLMYYSDAYSDWEYRPYGYYSSSWP